MISIKLKDPERCSGCGLCVVACRRIHGRERIKISDQSPVVCVQCEDAPCMNSCRVGAISRVNGVTIINRDLCVGCKLCMEACEYGAVHMDCLTAVKCTVCIESDNIMPACIESCPDGILTVSLNENHDLFFSRS